jgi:hypothetical protein
MEASGERIHRGTGVCACPSAGTVAWHSKQSMLAPAKLWQPSQN